MQLSPYSGALSTCWKGQTLLFDADDTLWENNIYFERVIASFISFLDHKTHTAAEVREHLNRIEHQTIAVHGYGTASFGRSLLGCFEELSGSPVTDEQRHQLAAFAESIAQHEMELLPGVAATLAQLAHRHRLFLVTKGSGDEQRDKLARSGLAQHFVAVEVPREKDPQAYCEIVARHALPPAETWMIGNSPRSDINPALAAGLHAVYIPHDFTWMLEREELTPVPVGQHLLQLRHFPALLAHF